jgi:hypothetical protein
MTTGGGLRAQESSDGAFLYYSNDVPEIWRRSLRPSAPQAQNAQTQQPRSAQQSQNAPNVTNAANGTDTRVMMLPRDAHWGGEWIAGERGIYYVNQQSAAGMAIELMPFRPAGRARPIRILPLTAPPSGGAVFSISPDESWMAWSQEDHRAADILMIERVP